MLNWNYKTDSYQKGNDIALQQPKSQETFGAPL